MAFKRMLLVVAAITFSAASCGSTAALRSVEIKKGAYQVGEDPYFAEQLFLPVVPGGSELLLPHTYDQAVTQILNGLSSTVLRTTVQILKDACDHKKPCDYSSPAVWDKFIEGTEAVYLENRQSLSSYLYRLSETLGQTWNLRAPCPVRRSICFELSSRSPASSEVLADIVVRGAIVRAAGGVENLDAIIHGLGDVGR